MSIQINITGDTASEVIYELLSLSQAFQNKYAEKLVKDSKNVAQATSPQQQPATPTQQPAQTPQNQQPVQPQNQQQQWQAPQQQQQPYQPPAAVPTSTPQYGQQPPWGQSAPHQPPASVPTSAPTYTFEQLARSLAGLAEKNRGIVDDLFRAFNITQLMQLPKEQYGAFATKLRELGVNV